jgi:hypothetical protein
MTTIVQKTLAREQTKTTVIARKLKRSVAAVYPRASKLAVMLGGGRGRKKRGLIGRSDCPAGGRIEISFGAFFALDNIGGVLLYEEISQCVSECSHWFSYPRR